MSERWKELLEDCRKYAKQAITDWLETVRTDPVQHTLTAIIAVAVVKVIGWIL